MENPFDDFFNYDPRKDLENFSKVPTETWLKLGEQKALENFHLAAKAVPAYKDFLKKNKVNPEKIKTIEDFKRLPLTTKENYFTKYSLSDLSMGGLLSPIPVIYSSSGSTGNPLYWPKSTIQEINTWKGVELLFSFYFYIDQKKTLVINVGSMGPWAAGDIIHGSTKMLSHKGLNISVISPGLDKDQFFSFFQDLADFYDQIIIAGYPSLIRTLVEEGLKKGIQFKNHDIGIFTGGERYTENWREYLTKKLGWAKPQNQVSSVLGTAETGTTSLSTPFADSFRILLHRNDGLRKKFFTRKDLPSINQYVPPARFVEIINNEIAVTSLGAIPLIRYNTKDYGAIMNPKDVISSLPKNFLKEFSIEATPNLPILAIYGRVDGTITLYALNIYPEQIAAIMESTKIKKYLTGKAIIEKLENKKAEPYLKLTLELKPDVEEKNLERKIRELVTGGLAKINIEYYHLLDKYGDRVKPIINLRSFGSCGEGFKSGKSIIIKFNDSI